MSWGRTSIAGPAVNGDTPGHSESTRKEPERRAVNVLATGSVDQVRLKQTWRMSLKGLTLAYCCTVCQNLAALEQSSNFILTAGIFAISLVALLTSVCQSLIPRKYVQVNPVVYSDVTAT